MLSKSLHSLIAFKNGGGFFVYGTTDDVVLMQHNYALDKKFVEAGKQLTSSPIQCTNTT
jgi:hypothetical protein